MFLPQVSGETQVKVESAHLSLFTTCVDGAGRGGRARGVGTGSVSVGFSKCFSTVSYQILWKIPHLHLHVNVFYLLVIYLFILLFVFILKKDLKNPLN